MKTIKYNNPPVGCYVDESSGSADDCNRRTIKLAQKYGFEIGDDLDEEDEDYSQILSEYGDSAVDYLNELETRSFMSWQFEDNSLFLMADIDTARGEVDFVSSKKQDCPDEDFRGEWLYVSDHGNCTLYVRQDDGKDVEIWSVV